MNRKQYLHDGNHNKIKLMDTNLVRIGHHSTIKIKKYKAPGNKAFGGLFRDK